jgi:integrase
MAIVKRWKRRGRPTVWRCDYLDAGDTRRRKTFATKEAAEDYAARATLDGRRHLAPTMDPSITVRDYAAHWLTTLRVKQGTIDTYRKHLDLYLLPALGALALREVRRPRVRLVLTNLLAELEAKGRKGRAIVRLALAVIRQLLTSAVSEELLTVNPAARLATELGLKAPVRRRQDEPEAPAGEERDGKAFPRPERDVFLTAAREEDPRCWRMWTVQVLTGLRPGELYALTEADLLLDQAAPKGPQLRVSKTLSDDGKRVETTPKGGKVRLVDLSAAAVDMLRAQLAWRKQEKLRRGWREMPTPLFFAEDGGYPLPCDIRKRMYAVLEAAGLSQRGPHALRHTYATLALGAGKDVYYVAKQLGHQDINLTFATYTRGDDASRPGALNDLDPPSAVTNL